ncbi:ribose 5-phosphate isomerase A [Puia dinghuensis]|uniref:Ribose 5-phosphate isomerase A n=1 Tax=Puia dinghuensis TaxID=1792502 RepID=A0A8J2UD13_9BACT|nr:ribose 5-phosphate isomerase A [Puia dinghuensis]GGB00233.1 ribose-5-phosphate isomerase [Puia dinghuensis]
MTDFKQQAAQEAAKLIQPGDTIGLGAGSTMIHLITAIKATPGLAETLTVASSSFSTRLRLMAEGFTVKESGWLSRLDWYFDGCDQFDHWLNALKSGGGVHTAEKILAAMADNFVLVGDSSKQSVRFDSTYPLVVEVIPEALSYVADRLKRSFHPTRSELRLSVRKDGAVITERGNFLIDSWFSPFPEPVDLNDQVGAIPGILEHSLFFNLAHKAITAGPDGIMEWSRPWPSRTES